MRDAGEVHIERAVGAFHDDSVCFAVLVLFIREPSSRLFTYNQVNNLEPSQVNLALLVSVSVQIERSHQAIYLPNRGCMCLVFACTCSV